MKRIQIINKIVECDKKYIAPIRQYIPYMIVVKISEKLEYKVEKLQRGIQVSKNIPKVVITASER